MASEVGKGSTFTLRLPRAADPEPCAAPPTGGTPVPPTSVPPAERCGALRILVIEDEESIRRFLEIALTHLGHRPHLTANAEEGLQAFAPGQFDVVLTDLGLPGASGAEVARRIAECAPGTPVVLLTGWADQLHAESRQIAGVSRVLGKPVQLETLAATLASLGG